MTYHFSLPPKTVVSFPRTKAWASVTVAANEADRIQGLHGRTVLGPNEGMLFLFPDDQKPPISMTMAKMQIPLDIIFIGGIDGDMTIRHIAHRLLAGRAAPALGPAVSLVLEVPSGFSRRHRLVRGDRVVIGLDS